MAHLEPGPEVLVAAARRGGVRDERVLGALARVRRERFVPPELVRSAFFSRSLASRW